MSLKEQISEDMKSAMRAKESARLGTLRLLLAAIKQKEIDEQITLDDAGVVTVIEKMLKQRKDSINQYTQAGRLDLASAEQFEADTLGTYMPTMMSSDEIAAAVQAAVAQCQATQPGDMGKVMGILKPQLAGKADMSEVSKHVKAALNP